MSIVNVFTTYIDGFFYQRVRCHRLFWMMLVSCVLVAPVYALINPKFTPVGLVEKSKSIVHLRLAVSGDTSTLTSRTVDVLKGDDPGITTVSVPFYLRSALADIVESGNITAVFVTGDYSDAGLESAGVTGEVNGMLKTDAGWYGLYGKKQPYKLGDKPVGIKAVWAGSADMLVSALKYILADPALAEIPVRAGVKWASAIKHSARLSNVNALLPVMTAGGKRLLFVSSSDGDKLFKVNVDGKTTEMSSAMNLASCSLKAAWSDMNADGHHDLLSWSGDKYTLYTFSGSAFNVHSSVSGPETVYSLCGAVLEGGRAAVVVAGTESGPQIIRLAGDGKKLSVTAVSGTTDRKQGGGPCVIADFNDDGINDIAEITKTHIFLYVGKSGGQFKTSLASAETYDLSLQVRPLVCDMNGDGHLDLILSGADGVEPYINSGNGIFMNVKHVSGEVSYIGKPGVVASSTADFNNDGKQEFILFFKDMGPLPFFNRGFACFGYASELELRESGLSLSDSIMHGQQAGLTADMDGDGKQETIIVTVSGDLVVLKITSRQERPLLSLEVRPALGLLSPCRINANARAQVMGARNADSVFPAFWGVRRKGPVDLRYKDEKGNSVSTRKIVIKPLEVRIKLGE